MNDKAFSVRSGTLKKYIADASLRLSDADRSFLADLAKVRIVDAADCGVHYSNKRPDARLDRMVEAGLLKTVDVVQPGRGNFKAYQFADAKIAGLFGGKLPVIGSKRNALHEVITSKIYFASGRPSSFKLEADLTKEERKFFTSRTVDGTSCLPDAVFYDAGGSVVVVEADSGQYTSSQIASKQAGWAGLQQVWGQPSKAAARVRGENVFTF